MNTHTQAEISDKVISHSTLLIRVGLLRRSVNKKLGWENSSVRYSLYFLHQLFISRCNEKSFKAVISSDGSVTHKVVSAVSMCQDRSFVDLPETQI